MAGGAGAAFGGAKLRDEHKKQYPKAHARAAATFGGRHRAGTGRLARAIVTEHPGFKTLAIGSAAGASTAAASHYGDHLKRVRANQLRREGVAKSEYKPGRFAPASTMGPRKTRALKQRLSDSPGTPVGGAAHDARYNKLSDVYAQHAFAQRNNLSGAHLNINAKTTPSDRHPNIHYGPTMTPALRDHVDNNLNPAATARLKHPVVFHHDPELGGNAAAAAIGAHSTSGNKGHVVLGAPYGKDGTFNADIIPGVKGHEVINHELAHAALKQRQPVRPGRTNASVIGEEARADATAKTSLYVKNGFIGRKKVLDRIAGMSPRQRSNLTGIRDQSRGGATIARRTVLDPGIRTAQHYHGVQRAVRVAAKVHKSWPGVSGRSQQTVSMTGRSLAKRAFSLHDMEYDEVSLVDVPANQHASIMIAKSFQGADMDPDEIFDADGQPVDEADLETGDIIQDADGQQYVYTAPEDVDAAEEFEPELVVAKRGNPLLGLSARQRVTKRQTEGTDLAQAISKALDEASSEAEQVQVIKNFAGAVGQMQARLTMVEKRAELDRDNRLTEQYIEVAKNLALPGVTPEEFGPILKRCGDFLDDDELEVLSKALDSTSGVLYEEFGYNGVGVEYGDPDTADAMAYAAEAVAKGGKIAKSVHGELIETPLSKAGAVEMYYEQNDDAYDAYVANRR